MKETIENTETTFEKGIGLEKEFATFLKTYLGWNKARIRVHLRQFDNHKGVQVDVIAERFDSRGRTLKILGAVYLILFAFLFLIGILNIDPPNSELYILLAVILEFGGGIAYIIGLIRLKEYVWVECKNRKGKTNIEDIRKAYNQYNSYLKTESKEYKFRRLYFVSAEGFIENALKFAKDNNIRCFNRENGIFQEVDYWKHY